MDYFSEGSATTVIDERRAGELLDGMVAAIGPVKRVLLVPPDISRFHSWAGPLACMLYERLKDRCDVQVLPAVGTHEAMTDDEIAAMYPGIPRERFHNHDWRHGVVELGQIPAAFIRQISNGVVDFPVTIEVDRLLVEGGFDRVISIGQLVPHEVIGIANYNKNIFVGVGGSDAINKTHFLSGVIGLENIMGRADNPVREVLHEATRRFASKMPPIDYLHSVRGRDSTGKLVTRGLSAGDDANGFRVGAKLSQEVNIEFLDRPVKKAVVYLEAKEFKTTWLGNKAVYRTRMAIADDGDLIVLAPGVRAFGEDKEIDRLIRKHGYRGTPALLERTKSDPELARNMSATAHLIHGSSEGRFRITYCPGHLKRDEVEGVGYQYGDLDEAMAKYRPEKLTGGWNQLAGGEEVFYVPNPGQGLWATRQRFGK